MAPHEFDLLIAVAQVTQGLLAQIEKTGGPSAQVGLLTVSQSRDLLDQALRAQAPPSKAEETQQKQPFDPGESSAGTRPKKTADRKSEQELTISASKMAVNRLLQAVDRCLYWDMAKGTGCADRRVLGVELEAAAIALAREVGWSRGAWRERS